MKTKNKKSGFTLVELMIVAAIIAILAAIVIPLLSSNRDRAIAADGQNLLGTTATAVKAYYAEHGTVPAFGDLPALTQSELGKSKYFAAPSISASAASGGGSFTYTLTAGLKAAVGSFAGTDTLILSDATGVPVWSGTVASKLGL